MSDPTNTQQPVEPSKFEKIKYLIDLGKWFIVSVALVVMTSIIDSGFKDRAAGITEIQTYDKYLTDLIVLNKEVKPRWLLAQYFANVTASDKLRERWVEYFKILDEDYNSTRVIVEKVDGRLKELRTKNEKDLTTDERTEKKNLEEYYINLIVQLKDTLRLPPQRHNVEQTPAQR